MAGRDHHRVRVRALTIDDGKNSPKRVVANLVSVLVDEGDGSEAKVCEIVSSFRSAGFVQFGCIHENEPDPGATFDVEGVPIEDAGYFAVNPDANRSRTIR